MNLVILQHSQAISRFNTMPLHIWPSAWNGADNDNFWPDSKKQELRDSIFNTNERNEEC